MVSVVIPARGGSKGIARKNMQLIGVETLIGRCVRTCVQVTSTIVSTDCDEIAEESKRCGAFVHRRSVEISGDKATSEDVVRAVQREYSLAGVIVMAQCTAPLMTPSDVDRCIDAALEPGAGIAIACHRFDDFVVEHGIVINRLMNPIPRRQDMAEQYVISGSCWAFDAQCLYRNIYTYPITPVLSDHPLRLDIDTDEDLAIARKVITGE